MKFNLYGTLLLLFGLFCLIISIRLSFGFVGVVNNFNFIKSRCECKYISVQDSTEGVLCPWKPKSGFGLTIYKNKIFQSIGGCKSAHTNDTLIHEGTKIDFPFSIAGSIFVMFFFSYFLRRYLYFPMLDKTYVSRYKREEVIENKLRTEKEKTSNIKITTEEVLLQKKLKRVQDKNFWIGFAILLAIYFFLALLVS